MRKTNMRITRNIRQGPGIPFQLRNSNFRSSGRLDHRLLVKNEKYSYPPLIIGHFHIKYMNFYLCGNVQ